MKKVWIRFNSEAYTFYRRMTEEEAATLANKRRWMPKVVEKELGEALDRLIGFEDRWVTVSDLLTADPFPDHLG